MRGDVELLVEAAGRLGHLLGAGPDFGEAARENLAEVLVQSCQVVNRAKYLPPDLADGSATFHTEGWRWARKGCPTTFTSEGRLQEAALCGRLRAYLERVATFLASPEAAFDPKWAV